jgi:hypothetical protein
MSAPTSPRPSLTTVRALALAAALPVAAVALGGCGGGGSGAMSTGGSAARQSPPATVAIGKGLSGSARAKTGASSRTRTPPAREASTSASATQPAATPAKSPGPASTQRPSSASGRRALRRFAGSGNTRLGTIVVRSTQVLYWRAARAPIQIFAANGFMLVRGSAPSGSIRLSRGTYRSVRVATRASWSIELRTPAP